MTDTIQDRTDETLPWRVNDYVRPLEAAGNILLRDGGRVVRITAENLVPLIELLVGHSNGAALELPGLAEMSADSRERLTGVLARLAEAGLLSEVEDGAAENNPIVTGLWTRAGGEVERAVIAARLAQTRVGVIGAGALADRVVAELRAAGVEQVTDHAEAPGTSSELEMAVVVGASEEDPLFGVWNTRTLADRGPAWLAVTPMDGQRFTVGPWVFPHTSACFRCYRMRLGSAFLDAEVGPLLPDAVPIGPQRDFARQHPTLAAMQATFVADQVLQHVGLRDGFGQAQPGAMTTIEYELTGITATNHRVLRVPRCPECSPAQGGGYPQVWFHKAVAPAEANR